MVAIAAIGFPGCVASTRGRPSSDLALDAPLATFVLVATLAPLAYYGRLLAIGLCAAGPCRSTRCGDVACRG